jgi:hypothetical protein
VGETSLENTSFPPADAAALLALCAGEWLSLRSNCNPEADAEASSARGELRVEWLAQNQAQGGLGIWRLQAPDGSLSQLHFGADGDFEASGGGSGHWQMLAGGQLQLEYQQGELRLQESIWFSKPNLRLRSLLQWQNGQLCGARFWSEIRRLSKPAN